MQKRGPFGTHQSQVPDNVPFPRLPSKSSARREQRAQGKGQGRVQHRRRRGGEIKGRERKEGFIQAEEVLIGYREDADDDDDGL